MTTEKRTEGGLYPEMLHQIISDFGEDKTEYTMFVESGTNYGETPEKLYNEFETLHTIELDQTLKIMKSNIKHILDMIV